MGTIYKKTLKGAEEVALRSFGLSQRLRPYLLLADGKASTDELQQSHAALPGVADLMKALAADGFLEEVTEQAAQARGGVKVVALREARVANGAPTGSWDASEDAPAPMATSPRPPAAAPEQSYRLEEIKQAMTRDVVVLLAADAAPVVMKIRNCRSAADLFVAMMGIKKIVALYRNNAEADRFAQRYAELASM